MSDQDRVSAARAPVEASATPPREPFPHMTNHLYFGFNSPVFLTFFALAEVAFGVCLFGMGVIKAFPLGGGTHWGPVLGGIFFVGIGAFGLYMGIRRWRWKRQYERVMGRSPW